MVIFIPGHLAVSISNSRYYRVRAVTTFSFPFFFFFVISKDVQKWDHAVRLKVAIALATLDDCLQIIFLMGCGNLYRCHPGMEGPVSCTRC